MRMLHEAKMLAKNYRGEIIPIAMGIIFVPIMLLNFLFFFILYRDSHTIFIIFLLPIVIMSFAGLIDDIIGNKNVSGLRGHFNSFFKGKLTSGILKAFIGVVTALIISLFLFDSLTEFLLDTLIMVLFTNLLNLFDLRPGRAIKIYLFLGIIFLLIGLAGFSQLILYSIIGFCIGYLPQDLRAKSMMGDTGSNALGMSLGIISVINFSIILKYLLLFILILIHSITEKYSISKIIENNTILDYIDQLGRN